MWSPRRETHFFPEYVERLPQTPAQLQQFHLRVFGLLPFHVVARGLRFHFSPIRRLFFAVTRLERLVVEHLGIDQRFVGIADQCRRLVVEFHRPQGCQIPLEDFQLNLAHLFAHGCFAVRCTHPPTLANRDRCRRSRSSRLADTRQDQNALGRWRRTQGRTLRLVTLFVRI